MLKIKGMTIKGVKNYFSNQYSELDEFNNKSINRSEFKTKLTKISTIIKNIKNNGKKNTH